MNRVKNTILKHIGFRDPVTETDFLKFVKEEDYEKVKQIVSKFRRFINITDHNGNTPLHFAVMNVSLDILDLLLSQWGILLNCENIYKQTPLYLATKYNRYEALKHLISAGANVNLSTKEKISPLHVSVNEPNIVHLLISNGANINAADYTGDTPLHYAVVEGCCETVYMLLYYNADANCISNDGLTPFMTALLIDRIEMQDVLFEYVTDFDLCYRHDVSTLKLAMNSNSPFIEQIIEKNVKISSDEFSWCIRYPNENMFKLIWDRIKYDDNHPVSIGNIMVLEKYYIEKYINIIIESPNIDFLLNFVTNESYFYFIAMFGEKQCSVDLLTKLTCLLLQHSYRLNIYELRNIFAWFGYCELLTLLLYMEYLKPRYLQLVLTPRLIFDIHANVKIIKDDFYKDFSENLFINPQNRWATIESFCIKRDVAHYLGYCADRPLVTLCKYDIPETLLPAIPKLVELARDTCREYIIKGFNVNNISQYYTVVDNLPITQICKKILKFEIKLYQISLSQR